MIQLQTCTHCQTVHYPMRDVCSHCWSDTLIWADVSACGTVTSVTDLHISAKAEWRDALPLRLGLVALDAGVTILAFLNADLAAHDRVVLRKDNNTYKATLKSENENG